MNPCWIESLGREIANNLTLLKISFAVMDNNEYPIKERKNRNENTNITYKVIITKK